MKKLLFAPLSILLLFAPLSISAQSDKDIREGRKLPDFKTALEWNVNDTLEGYLSNLPYLPILDACHFGEYKAQLYFYKGDTLYKFGNPFKVLCFENGNYPNVPLSNSERELFSKSYRANANGRWYAVILEIECGYVYTHQVQGKVFAWRLDQLPCN